MAATYNARAADYCRLAPSFSPTGSLAAFTFGSNGYGQATPTAITAVVSLPTQTGNCLNFIYF